MSISFKTPALEKMGRRLERRAPVQEKFDAEKELSLKESVIYLAPKLLKMSQRGFTTPEIVQALEEEGLPIKAATLNRYLNEYQKRLKPPQASAARAKTPAQTEAQTEDAKAPIEAQAASAGEAVSNPPKAEIAPEKSSEFLADSEAETKTPAGEMAGSSPKSVEPEKASSWSGPSNPNQSPGLLPHQAGPMKADPGPIEWRSGSDQRPWSKHFEGHSPSAGRSY